MCLTSIEKTNKSHVSIDLLTQTKALPLWLHPVMVMQILMVVIWGVEVAKHGDCFHLGPTTPCCKHPNSLSPVLQTILATSTTERVCPIKCPPTVSQSLHVLCKSMTDNWTCLGEDEQEIMNLGQITIPLADHTGPLQHC